ncbi:uncharacterized protein LOC136091990 [Hydra vulgaris]|uniref:Uncharacterized protein LOC136091990 n=1 Tax=Hydra vulgaris TaxID=6087 RepID=A0ABM4DML4_HYDVU
MDNSVPLVESQSHLEANNNIDTLLHTNAMVVVKQINNKTDEEHQDTYQTDIGLCKSVSKNVQEYFIRKESAENQNITDNFEKSQRVYDNPNRIRYCSSALFTRIRPLTNEKSNRTWRCYSPINGKIYCFICKLLSSTQTDLCHGINDWINAKLAFVMHKKSPCHLAASLTYIEHSRLAGRVVIIHEEGVESQTNFWRSVLERVVDVIKFFAARGLPFRGHVQKFGSHENGNYKGILEVLAKYDPFLAIHIEKKGNSKRRNVSCLSSTI